MKCVPTLSSETALLIYVWTDFVVVTDRKMNFKLLSALYEF